MLNDVLFELGTEELPSAAVKNLSEALIKGISEALVKVNVNHGSIKCFATPRRLAFLISNVAELQLSQVISKRGPADSSAFDENGNPTPALIGFAKSCEASIQDLKKTETEKGSWWTYETKKPGTNIRVLLPSLLQDIISQLPISKPMRWGDGIYEFARPVHWVILLYGSEIIPCDILGIQTDRKSFGHRFHHPKCVEIPSPSLYESTLTEAYVIADFATRRKMIVEQVQNLAAQNDAIAIMPDDLIDEVTSIVEWPKAMLVEFSSKFLEVPPEALIAAMQSHQKCFALCNSKKELLPYFITVANIESKNPEQVRQGNEKVMTARLSDADFFFRQDRKKPLADYWPATEKVTFQTGLGTLADKSRRLQLLITSLQPDLEINPELSQRAAFLAKCDLMTGMVGEFPELQGFMGNYYALHDKEISEVAVALNEQYLPRFAADNLPSSPLGKALSLVDRIDTLVGTFALGLKPTGMKDPYKLRRHALAVARILITNPISITLSKLIQNSLKAYGNSLSLEKSNLENLKPFILERVQSFYSGQGISIEIFNAVLARQDDCLYDLDNRIRALIEFIQMPEAKALSAACKRVNNILQAAKLLNSAAGAVDLSLFTHEAERDLFQQIEKLDQEVEILYRKVDYENILKTLASLRKTIDAFFDNVMVMVDDEKIKTNRLLILLRLQTLLQGVADISQLPVLEVL